MAKKSIEEEINAFFEIWDCKQLIHFLRDILHLFELYDVEDESDWVAKQVGGDEENVSNIRLIRTVYLISKIAEIHGGKLCSVSIKFKNLWRKMEKIGAETKEELRKIEQKCESKFPGMLDSF